MAGVKTNPSIIVQESRVVTRKDKATRSNGPSNVFPVITGQSNRSPSNVPVIECCWGQDEHPLKKRTHKGDDETGGKNEAAHSLEEGMHSQGDVSSEEVQDDVQPVVEQTAANSLEDEMHQGAHSLEDVQDDVQKVVECQAHSLEDVLEHGG